MKKIIYYFFTILSICSLVACLFIRDNYYEFSSTNVKNNIEYLSSNKFQGRLAGTENNEMVAEELKETFKDYNLIPLSSDYLEPFNLKVPIYNGEKSSLKMYNGSTLIKDFKLGQDFKEDLINFKTTNLTFSKSDKVEILPKSIYIQKGSKHYLFYVTYDKGFPFRSSFIYDSDVDFAIQINTNTFNDILNGLRDGNTLDVNLPYTAEDRTVYNVVGKLEGSDKDLPPLILTAHFDHLGVDSLGTIYPGALDNSSGTAFLLELARNFSSLKTPKRDIIFVALNGEECGLRGSQAFAEIYKEKLAGAEIINFDMIGASDCPITFMNGANTEFVSSELLDSLSYICATKDLPYNTTYNNCSDHASFVDEGFNSLTITHNDISKIHTPYDTAANISTSSIDEVYTLVNSKITDYAYYDITLLMYNKNTLLFFSLTSFGLIIFAIRLRFFRDIFD